jgi:hypothetical protein
MMLRRARLLLLSVMARFRFEGVPSEELLWGIRLTEHMCGQRMILSLFIFGVITYSFENVNF